MNECASELSGWACQSGKYPLGTKIATSESQKLQGTKIATSESQKLQQMFVGLYRSIHHIELHVLFIFLQVPV